MAVDSIGKKRAKDRICIRLCHPQNTWVPTCFALRLANGVPRFPSCDEAISSAFCWLRHFANEVDIFEADVLAPLLGIDDFLLRMDDFFFEIDDFLFGRDVLLHGIDDFWLGIHDFVWINF